jgi:hypothetical protein
MASVCLLGFVSEWSGGHDIGIILMVIIDVVLSGGCEKRGKVQARRERSPCDSALVAGENEQRDI